MSDDVVANGALRIIACGSGEEPDRGPPGCVAVAQSGGQFTSIQAAINSLSTVSAAAQCIFIDAGTYSEQILVPPRAAQLTIYGSTTDTSGYAANQVLIAAGRSQADGLSNDETATLRVKAGQLPAAQREREE